MKYFILTDSLIVKELIKKEKLKWVLYWLGYTPLGILLITPDYIDLVLGFIAIFSFWGATLLVQYFIENKLRKITRILNFKFKVIKDTIHVRG